MQKYKSVTTQVALFLLVGGTTFLIDLCVTLALSAFFHLPPYIASSIGFLSGFFFNFPMNRKRVFRHSINDRFSIAMQILFYVCLSLFNLGATALLSQVFVSQGIYIGYVKFIVTAMIAVWNFFIFKFFVFSKKHAPADDVRPLDL